MRRMLVVLGMAAVAAGCGKSAEQKAAEETAKAAERIAQGAQQAAQGAQQQGAQQMAQGLQQMAQQMQGDAKAVEFERLIALLPEVGGWTRSEPEGSQSSVGGFTTSRAEAEYSNGDARMTLEIQDIALAKMMLAGLQMYTAAGYSERTSRGFKRSATIGGHPGIEEWQNDSKDANVTAIVAGRYVVTARADDVPNTDSARKLIEAIDLAKLAALK